MTTINTYDYDFLIRSLTDGSIIFKADSIKRLTVLSQNDKKQFLVYCKNILNALESLYNEEKQQINHQCLQLLGQIMINYNCTEIQNLIVKKHLPYLIQNLGHQNKPIIRKNSHTSLLAYLKVYENFDKLIQMYLNYGFTNRNQLVRQKSINSFQSILILQIKQYNWHSDISKQVMENLLGKLGDQNPSIAKASAQCILTMCKIDGVKIVVSKLSLANAEKLRIFLEEWMLKANLQLLAIKPKDIEELMSQTIQKSNEEKQKDKKDENIEMNRNNNNDNNNNNNNNNNSTNRRLQKIRNSIKTEQKKYNDRETIPHNKLFSNFNHEGTIKEKTQAAEDLLYRIQINSNKPQFESSAKAILPNVIKMLKDPNPKIVGLTLRILENIITILHLDDNCLNNLQGLIVQKLGDQKISIRQMVVKVIQEMIKNKNKGRWIKELLNNLKKNINTFFKDEILSLILHIFEKYTNDEINYPINQLLEDIIIFTQDPKTKIKIRSLDCLAQIVFRSQEFEKHNNFLKGKISPIFYQMYHQKVNKLLQQHQKKLLNNEKRRKFEQISNNGRKTFNVQKHNPELDNLNISIDLIKKRVSHLRKHRNGISTRQTTSFDNSINKDRMQDVELILPQLEQKSRTNKILKSSDYSPNKTQEHNKGFEYLTKQDLKPLRDAQKELKIILGDLKSTDWKILFQSTNKIRRIIEYNPQQILNMTVANLHNLVLDILSLVESLRSSVSKNGLICLGELIKVINRLIDPEIQIILDKLLKKSADTNVFISQEVQKCFKNLSENASSSKLLEKLITHRENKTIAIKDSCINILLNMKDIKKIREKQYPKLAQSLGFYMMESQQEIRKKAKIGVIDLCKNLGDWYRSLRGKVNQGCFKSICQLMTKPNNIKNIQTIDVQSQQIQNINQSVSKTIDLSKRRKKSRQLSISTDNVSINRKLMRPSQFPNQFNDIQSLLQLSNSSDWRKRMQCLQKVKNIALSYPNQFSQHRSANHLIDVICRQVQQPNIKVSINAMETFLQIEKLLRNVIVSNLGILSNSIFNCLSSNRVEIKEFAEKCSSVLLNQIETQIILQFLCNGILYSLPKSRIYLINKLTYKFQNIYRTRKQLLFKHIFPLVNKLMDQYRAQLMTSVVGLLVQMQQVMGNQMFSHLTKFKEVRELISK